MKTFLFIIKWLFLVISIVMVTIFKYRSDKRMFTSIEKKDHFIKFIVIILGFTLLWWSTNYLSNRVTNGIFYVGL